MSKPTLYGPAFSTYVRSARLALEEKGVDYNLVEIDFLQGPMPAEQIERHPFARVPAFEHDGFQLYETTAICRYVDEAFDGPALQPGNVQERARMNQIISILDNYTYPCTVGQLVIQRLVMPMLGNDPDESAIAAALPEIDTNMTTIAALRGNNTFLAGNQLSLADLHFAPIYDYFKNTPESGPILDKTPGLGDWWNEMSGRASLQKTPPLPG
jgi:glutathione S-transferase